MKRQTGFTAQSSPVSWMRAVFDLLKIVHGFRVPETVLFEFFPGAAA
jgi:hypothetical protein